LLLFTVENFKNAANFCLPFGGLLEAAVEVATTLELGAERVEPATIKKT
jgi:hypothetical protein